MMMSATIFAGMGTLAAMLLALLSWRQARLAAARSAALADALAVALESSMHAEDQQEELREIISALRGRLDRMVLKQGRMSPDETREGYQAAIDLTREGADDEVIMNTCGLSRGEAHLIRNLYQGHAH